MQTVQPIKDLQLVFMTLGVSLGIFMNILDVSIANVAIPTIAGNVGVSVDEGTWVITSFSVSTAIVLPLTGWLARRFGEVRLFVTSTALFTFFSFMCGLSNSLPMLIFFRVLQGAVAGPMIPLSQSLLLANYPPHKKGLATALWSTVAVAAPVLGPILGGYITDNYAWPWIFYINIPVGILSIYITWTTLHNRETEKSKTPIDFIGLILLIIGVGSLQILLDQGKDLDWYNSNVIISLTVASIVALSFFIVWELTDKNPIVDLTLFRRRNFAIGTTAISLGYMVYFGGVVILPLWLQTQMNYTPTWAGLVTAPLGIIPVMLSPFMGRIMNYIDLRIIVSIGFTVFATCSFWQSSLSTDVGPTTIALIRLIQGIGSPCFFIPLITILFSGLPDKSVASAAGLSNFLRILAGSFGTSISVTLWAHREAVQQSKLVEYVTSYDVPLHNAITQLQSLGFTLKASYAQIYAMVTNQSYMLATNDIFWLSGYIFISLIILIWFAKPPFLTKGKAVLSE